MGNSSNDSLRNTLLVPITCTINKIAFSIREYASAVPYTATLFVNNISTPIQAVIVDGSLSHKISNNSEQIILSELDQISVQVTFTNGALSRGACISLYGYEN